jgi:catechol-2,3-dioxygenase
LKDRGIDIKNVSDHGISIRIYFSDPDGNGIEVSYELPPREWPRQERIFARDSLTLGRFPGPWHADAAHRAS